MIPPCSLRRPARHGVVLVAVIVVVAAMSLSAYSFARWMRAEARAAEIELRTVQARLAAESAVELTRALVMGQRRGFSTANLDDVPSLFRNVALFEPDEDVHPRLRARFTVMAPVDVEIGTSQFSGVRYGVSDENAKIDLNAWALRDPVRLEQVLQLNARLPEQLAHDVVSWITPVELSTLNPQLSTSLPNPQSLSLTHSPIDDYRPKHAPLASFDELLLVRGMTREYLYGEEEAEVSETGSYALASAYRSVPLDRFTTLYSRSGTLDRTGRPRIRLNQPDLTALYRELLAEFDESLARFVIALRVFGSTGHAGGGPSAAPAALAGGGFVIPSILDLLVPEVSGVWKGRSVTIRNPLYEQGSPTFDAAFEGEGNSGSTAGSPGGVPTATDLLDRVTVSEADVRLGVVNINTAPAEALAILPGLTEEEEAQILASRRDDEPRQGIAWLVTENVISPQTFRRIEPLITGQSDALRVRAVGAVGDRGPLVELDAVIDATRNPPELLSYKTTEPPSGRFRDELPLAEEPHPLPSDYDVSSGGTRGATRVKSRESVGWASPTSQSAPDAAVGTAHPTERFAAVSPPTLRRARRTPPTGGPR